MKKIFTLLAMLIGISATANAQKYVGGDISLVPAYEAAGDVWLDAEGNSINSTYDDGMIGFVKEKAKWNAIRVRLLVDPTADDNRVLYNDSLATCQDIEYVKKLGKRIKDAGMSFLLDIFYSDTWTDVKRQWMPDSWGFTRNTATATVAAKVKSYTTEVLNTLTAYGAKPDFIQIGNEVSYGMLWDDIDTKVNSTWFFNNSSSYETQKEKIERFATLLNAAAEGVRASNAATAKIILHNERTNSSIYVNNFYSWMEQAGFTDYDIIGLSYYPLWHGYLSNLKGVLDALKTNFPTKKVQIVETGYHHTTPTIKNEETNTSSTWPYTPAGQASFLADLIELLNTYNNVDGLYYWQPEECGNGADESGKNRVMNHYDYRGFWNLDWKSSTPHTMKSNKALMTLMTFIGETPEDDEQATTVADFENLDFENGESDYKWIMNWNQGWTTNWFYAPDEWMSSLVGGNWIYKTWVDAGNTLSAGNLIYQSKDNMPAGTYTIKAVIHTDLNGIYLFANDNKTIIPTTTNWGTAYEVSVQTTLTETGTLSFGLTLPESITTTASTNLYADNFNVTVATTGVYNINVSKPADNNWYTISGQRINKPTKSGVYINNGKKIVMK